MLQDSLRYLAPLIAQSLVISAIVLSLIAWSLWSAFWLFTASSRLKREFGAAARQAEASPDENAFAMEYETFSAAVARLPLIGPSWRGFAGTFVIPAAPGRTVTGTADPRDWFDLASLFRRAGSDLRYQAALPGLLVGAGLMFTFLGLAAALTAASDVVAEGVSQTDRNEALRTLLGAASVKFITSLAGLLLSIVYALIRKWRVRSAEEAFAAFTAALHRRIPFRTAAYLQAEANILLERQNAEIQRIGTDFFVNLGSTLERTFDSGLDQHIGPLVQEIQRLREGMATQSQDAMQGMTSDFLKRLEGAVGENILGAAATLKELSGRLDGLQTGMDAAARRMSEAAEEIASGMGRGAAAGVGRLAGPIEALLAQLRDLSAGQRAAGEASATALAATMARAAAALEATAAQVAAVLGGGAQDASARLVTATEAMRDDLRGVLDRFGASLDDSGRALTQGAEAGGAALLGAAASFGGDVGAAAAKLAQAGESAGAALRAGAADAQAGLTQSAGALGSGSAALAERLSALGAASAELAERAVALDRAAASAQSPLVAAAADLRAAAQAAQTAAAPLRDAAGSVAASADGLAAAASAMSVSQREADQLASRLTEAAARFAGLDEGLARTLRELGEGLRGYQASIAQFVTGVDGGFATSVQQLAAIATELTQAAEDLHNKSDGRAG